jgi:ABC-type transport system involved in multi-copper enzyme maturation permease subunit
MSNVTRSIGGLTRVARLFSRMLGDGNPVLSFEVLSIMRLKTVKVVLIGLPLLLTMLVVAIAAASDSVGSRSAEAGGMILGLGVSAALYVVAVVGAVLGAQAISSERQSGTLDLLLATGMTPVQIVVGKAMAVWIVLALMLLACVPPLGICFVSGGVSLGQLVAAVVTVLVLSAVPVSLGVGLGAALKSARLAVGSAVVAVGLVAPFVFSMLWMATLAAIGVDQTDGDWPFRFPAIVGHAGRFLVGGVVLPLYLVVMPSWLFLSMAVHALSSVATDRARPLRTWLVTMGPAGAVIAALLAATVDLEDSGALGVFGCLGTVLAAGTLALAAHPVPRRLPPGRAARTIGPNGDAVLCLVVTLASLGLAAAFLWPFVGYHILLAGALVVTFVLCLAGSGVFFSTLLRPWLARLALFGLGVLVLLAPLVAMVFVDALGLAGSATGTEDLLVNLSPLGAYFQVAIDAHNVIYTTEVNSIHSDAMPQVSIVLWTILGVALWSVGAARMQLEQEQQESSATTAA